MFRRLPALTQVVDGDADEVLVAEVIEVDEQGAAFLEEQPRRRRLQDR